MATSRHTSTWPYISAYSLKLSSNTVCSWFSQLPYIAYQIHTFLLVGALLRLTCMCVCVCVYIYIYMCVCVCVCVCIWTCYLTKWLCLALSCCTGFLPSAWANCCMKYKYDGFLQLSALLLIKIYVSVDASETFFDSALGGLTILYFLLAKDVG